MNVEPMGRIQVSFANTEDCCLLVTLKDSITQISFDENVRRMIHKLLQIIPLINNLAKDVITCSHQRTTTNQNKNFIAQNLDSS